MNGFLNLLKPPGMTSHDVVQVVRRTLHTRSVGHTGTLDPAAAGVLVLTVGQATRLGEYLLESDKTYRAEITLGVTTDSADAEGVITSCASAAAVTEPALRDALGELTGTITMRPPAHSAIRVGGQRLYKLARAGEPVEAPERTVEISELRLLEFHPSEPDRNVGRTGEGDNAPTATVLVEVTCSKGTYIRSLASMLGDKLGCGGYLSLLIRTRVGAHTIAEAATLEELAQDPVARIIAAAQALPHLPQPTLDAPACEALRHGQAIDLKEALPPGPVLVYNVAGELVCLAEVHGVGLQPRKVFVP